MEDPSVCIWDRSWDYEKFLLRDETRDPAVRLSELVAEEAAVKEAAGNTARAFLKDNDANLLVYNN